MKNLLFMLAGVTIIAVILISTFLAGPEAEAPVTPPVDEPVATSEVRVYFGSTVQDPDTLKCDVVYPVTRTIEVTKAEPMDAIFELLSGVTNAEATAGYFTSLNADATVESLSVIDGVATVEFGAGFATGLAGSCRVSAVRAQVEQTLLNFPEIESVVIHVAGMLPEEVLQP